MTEPTELERFLARHGLACVLALAALVLLAGLGMRDPWPADEPRFAVIARDMLASGDWLIPRIGGAIYADKPPVYFWLLAAGFWLSGSVRAGFLLPTVIAGFVTVACVYDATRRLYDRSTAAWAGIVLLATFQFGLEFKEAQIDPTLTMLTTLSLYGLLRHLLLGPAWGWYAFGGFAAGLGVITKGVGFLPLLVLAPYALLALRGWSVAVRGRSWRWASAPLAAVAATALWLVPLLIAARDSPELTAYRDEILLGQTVGRYVAAPGHWQPWWYFVGAVIPWAWAPVTLALPWLWPEWRRALRARDTRVALLLAWIALVVVFFSLSSGKRGVYVLPAVPALAIVTSPYVGALLRRAWLHRLAFGAVLVIALAASAGALYYGWLDRAKFVELMDGYSISPFALLLPPAVLALVTLVIARPRRGLGAFVSFMLGYWVVYGWWLWPLLDEARSGRVILQRAYAMLPADTELGVVEQKESLLLHADGAFTNFGHRRVDVEQERSDAARWLAAEPHRELLIRAEARPGCFDAAPAVTVGRAHGIEWQLVPHSAAVPACAARGRAANAIAYHAQGAPRSLSLASVVSAWRLR